MSQEVELAFELGWTTPAFRSMFGTNNGIAGDVLMLGGTPEQKQDLAPQAGLRRVHRRLRPDRTRGRLEPRRPDHRGAARRRGLGDRRNQALHHQRAAWPTLFMVFARSSKESRPIDGISAFVVPAGTPGLTVGTAGSQDGPAGRLYRGRALSNEVRVGPEALVGGEPRATATGPRCACLAHGRLHIAAICVGMAGAPGRGVDRLGRRAPPGRQADRRVPARGAMLADSQTELMAARALVREAAAGLRRRRRPPPRPGLRQALRLRDGRPGGRPGRADPRRRRLHPRRRRSSASTATRGCSASTRARARSSSS